MDPLVCLRHEEPDDLGVGEEVLRSRGVPVEYVDASEVPRALPSLNRVSGIVVLGGSMNADETERFPFLAPEQQLLREAVRRGLPVLGICLGGQLLARAMGAAVKPCAVPELGFVPVHPTPAAAADPLLSVFQGGDLVFSWHLDEFELPSQAVLLLAGDVTSNQAFRVGGRAWGLQFHPEVTRAELDAWLELEADVEVRWGRHPDDVRRDADRHLPSHQALAEEVFVRFGAVLEQDVRRK